MGDHFVEDGAFINSIVGEGTRFRGELDLNGLLRIDGDYTGVIRTPDKVLVGKNGRAECTIYAGTIVIGGVVKGNIYSSEKIIVLNTGMVIGNITTPRLIVEEGVILDGECCIQKDVNIEEYQNRSTPKETYCEDYCEPVVSASSGGNAAGQYEGGPEHNLPTQRTEAHEQRYSALTAVPGGQNGGNIDNPAGSGEDKESKEEEEKPISVWNG